MEEKQIGVVDHFFGNISVSMIKLTDVSVSYTHLTLPTKRIV